MPCCPISERRALRAGRGPGSPAVGAAASAAALGPVIASDAVLCSDGAKAYAVFAARHGLHHEPVNLAAGIRVRDGAFHVQNVNAYHGRLKGWMARLELARGIWTEALSGVSA